QPFKCRAEVKKFKPSELPALYCLDDEGVFRRSLEHSQEIADPLWGSVLGNLQGARSAGGAHGRLFFNWDNPLIRRLVQVSQGRLRQRSVQILYVQALLLGHHPLNAKEMRLLNDGLLGLLE